LRTSCTLPVEIRKVPQGKGAHVVQGLSHGGYCTSTIPCTSVCTFVLKVFARKVPADFPLPLCSSTLFGDVDNFNYNILQTDKIASKPKRSISACILKKSPISHHDVTLCAGLQCMNVPGWRRRRRRRRRLAAGSNIKLQPALLQTRHCLFSWTIDNY
jgi:hypothetical protein